MCFCHKLFVQLSTVKNDALNELFIIIIINITASWSGTVHEGNDETETVKKTTKGGGGGEILVLSKDKTDKIPHPTPAP